MTAMLLLGGLALLVVGGELLVRGAVRLAERAGMSPLLVGLTLVGFGTSMPELVASVQAAAVGSPGIAVGNIVGSNLANLLLILGAAALVCPMAVESRALRRDGSVVLGTAVLLLAAAWSWGLSRPVGAVFVALLATYLAYAYRQERDAAGVNGHTAAFDRAQALEGVDRGLHGPTPAPRGAAGWLIPLATALAGLGAVVLGGRFLVDGAVQLARLLGLSEAVIGLTVVAVGTSVPELVTSVVAALRRQPEVALGNVLGSNIYNVLFIGGVTGLLAPTPVPPEIARFDAPLMVGASVLLLAFAATGLRIGRREGAVLLASYVTYLGLPHLDGLSHRKGSRPAWRRRPRRDRRPAPFVAVEVGRRDCCCTGVRKPGQNSEEPNQSVQ